MQSNQLTQEQIDELNAIFRIRNGGKRKKPELVWESALSSCEIGDYQIVPLTSSWALRQEGYAMQHCVGGYVERCVAGLTRVFSVRDMQGHRIATVALEFDEDFWCMEQIKGRNNNDVCLLVYEYYDGEKGETVTQLDMTDLHYVAHEVLRCYRRASERELLKLIVRAAENGGEMLHHKLNIKDARNE